MRKVFEICVQRPSLNRSIDGSWVSVAGLFFLSFFSFSTSFLLFIFPSTCIYSYNSDGLSLMDVAVLTNNTEMVKLLIQHGAREGMECKSWIDGPSCKAKRFMISYFLLLPGLIELQRRRNYQIAVKTCWVCIWFNYSAKPRNSWKRKASRRPVRSEPIWTSTSLCGSGECASCAKWKPVWNSWVSFLFVSQWWQSTVFSSSRFPLWYCLIECRSAKQSEPGSRWSGWRTFCPHLVASTRSRFRCHLHQI